MTGAGAGAGAGAAGGGSNSVRAGSVEALTEHVRDIFTHPRARFVLKYRHTDAKLSLRVTDDVKTAKYKTRRQADLGKVKRLVGAIVAGKESDDMDVDPSSPRRASKKKGKKAKKGL